MEPSFPKSVKSNSDECSYIHTYRRRLENTHTLPSRILSYLEIIKSTTRYELHIACQEKLGCKKGSGSINASIKVLEVDGYITVDGASPNSAIRFVKKHHPKVIHNGVS